ncbi:FG-GAP-like repeat-containing protein [Winogradskyella sp. 3972H.M.0a.05]|uniref:FG-GAP repeat domain-containing protein n=1 Tax=Winogradskyella sp. 3972H.M.0a.05 TaxID=2950277 RepID=UPI003398AF4B
MRKPVVALVLVLSFFCEGQDLKFVDVSNTNLPPVSLTKRNSMDAKVGDIDGDGDLDIAVAVEFVKNILLVNDGSGKFSDASDQLPDIEATQKEKPYPYYPYHDTEDIALKDFDNDGDLDLIFVTEDDKVNEYYLNDGKGNFKDVTDAFPAKGTSNGVVADDFDNDGWIDVVIANNGQNVYLKNNKGKFEDQTSERLPTVENITQDMQTVDFDGDGDLDILVANENKNNILLNNGKGHFEDVTSKYISDESLGDETREATYADIDNDGDLDIYFANVYMFQQRPPIQRLLINENGKYIDKTQERLGFTDTYNTIDASFSDFDKDGDEDLLLLSFGKPLLFLNDGKGYFKDVTNTAFGTISADGVDAEIADFNGDGKLDIFIGAFRGSDVLLLQQ